MGHPRRLLSSGGMLGGGMGRYAGMGHVARIYPPVVRSRAASIVLVLIAASLLVAGTLTWRMTSPPTCPVPTGALGYICEDVHPSGTSRIFYAVPHRTHPLRAELLWAAGGVAALGAVIVEVRRRKGR